MSSSDILDTASSIVEVDLEARRVTRIEVNPSPTEGVDALVGVSIGSQFRRVLAECASDELAGGTLTAQLLDDTPVTALIAGSSLGRQGLIARDPEIQRMPLTDVCAGWRAGGLMIRAVEENDIAYLGEGPLAPSLDNESDPMAWHGLDELPLGAMRRRRRLDISPAVHGFDFDVVFRDSYIEPDGRESVVHEYAITGRIDAIGVVIDLAAIPHVLPSPECPAAAASAQRIVGLPLNQIRGRVGAEFSGISTCTHLNDACRSIGGLARAVAILRQPIPLNS